MGTDRDGQDDNWGASKRDFWIMDHLDQILIVKFTHMKI